MALEFFAWMIFGATAVVAGMALGKIIEIGQER